MREVPSIIFICFCISILALIVSVATAFVFCSEESKKKKQKFEEIEKKVVRGLAIPPPDTSLTSHVKWRNFTEEEFELMCQGYYGKRNGKDTCKAY